MYKYERSTTRSRREANKPRFVHCSKWIDVVPDADGEPEYRVHFKTKVLTETERYLKMMKTKHGRAERAQQMHAEVMQWASEGAAE